MYVYVYSSSFVVIVVTCVVLLSCSGELKVEDKVVFCSILYVEVRICEDTADIPKWDEGKT